MPHAASCRLAAVVFLGLLLAGCARLKPADESASASPLAQARQLLLVTAETWNSTQGELRRFERDASAAPWRLVGWPVAVNLGRGGLGWGLGLHGGTLGPDPEKREGDGRAPAGLFALGEGFAYDPAEAGAHGVPVLRADADLLCVDDSASRFYNRFARRSEVPAPDWTSAEDMLRKDVQYRLGALVRHNMDPVTPNRGSCIFLHIWLAPGRGTAGCTSMDAPDMLALLRWLDAAKAPVLAQLPRAEYARLRAAWGLPEAAAAP